MSLRERLEDAFTAAVYWLEDRLETLPTCTAETPLHTEPSLQRHPHRVTLGSAEFCRWCCRRCSRLSRAIPLYQERQDET